MYTHARVLASPRAISLQTLAALTAIDTHIARYIASYMAMQVSHPGTNVLIVCTHHVLNLSMGPYCVAGSTVCIHMLPYK